MKLDVLRLNVVALAAALVSVLVWSLPAFGADAPSPLEVYGRLPSLEDLAISPDGNRLALVRTVGDTRSLFLVDLSSAKMLGGARLGDTKLRSVSWIDNDHLLTDVSSTSLPPFGFYGPMQEWTQLLVFDLIKNKLRPVDFRVSGEDTLNVAEGEGVVREFQGTTTLFVQGVYVADRTLPGLFSYDVATGRMRLLRKGLEPDTEWLIDESGRVTGEYVYNDREKAWSLGLYNGNLLKVVASGKAAVDIPSIVGFDASGKSIVMQVMDKGDWVWRPVSLSDGSMGPSYEDGVSFVEEITDRRSGRIVGGFRDLNKTDCRLFDNEMQAHWNAVLRAFPDERVDLVSRSDDFSRIVVRVFGKKDGYVFALFDWYTHQTQVLGKVYQDLAQVSEVKIVRYHAADGLEIPAILTLPHGRAPTHLPLVVLPHGGPAASDSDRFDWWAQALADQGYAVLQPNYRGSDLGPHFLAEGFGQWGRKMQTDLSDGVRYLTQEGTIDPKRVCIVGASYGGYAALAGATLDASVYRCAVSVAGLSDLPRMLKWENEQAGRKDNLTQRYWDRFMGVSGRKDPALAAISPIEHIEAITAPILLIHGKDDTVVAYEQSEVMASALKKAGKSVQFVTLKHEDHWLSRSATRLEMLQATVAFLRTNNPPD